MDLVRRWFHGDDGRVVRAVQAGLYPATVHEMCITVEGEYRRAARLVDVYDEVTRTLNRIDHHYEYERVEAIHDAIAACFRASLGEHPDQLALGESPDAMMWRLRNQWHVFFQGELKKFCEGSSFVRAVALCMVGQRFSDTAEDALRDAIERIEGRLEGFVARYSDSD